MLTFSSSVNPLSSIRDCVILFNVLNISFLKLDSLLANTPSVTIRLTPSYVSLLNPTTKFIGLFQVIHHKEYKDPEFLLIYLCRDTLQLFQHIRGQLH